MKKYGDRKEKTKKKMYVCMLESGRARETGL